MGTRGFVGVKIDGEVKASYNHYDSYPSELGRKTLAFVRKADFDQIQKQARGLLMVKESEAPGEVVAAAYGHGPDSDWYAILRDDQGDIAAMLERGVMTDCKDFPLDSLFCEWGYLVNLDTLTLEVYKGFQHATPTNGHWAGKRSPDDSYGAVNLIASFRLGDLPSDDEFLKLEKQDGDDE